MTIDDIVSALGDAIDSVNFTVTDQESAAGDLIVSIGSTNQALLPLQNLSVSGSGSQRTLNIDPVDGVVGTSRVTITVSDGTAEAIGSFEIIVYSVPAIVCVARR